MTKRIKAFFRKKGADKPIFFAVFVLICLGIVMIVTAKIFKNKKREMLERLERE